MHPQTQPIVLAENDTTPQSGSKEIPIAQHTNVAIRTSQSGGSEGEEDSNVREHTSSPFCSSHPVLEPLLAPEEKDIDTASQKQFEQATTPTSSLFPQFGSIRLLEPWFPELNPEHHTLRTRRSRRRTMIWICFAIAVTIFLINTIIGFIAWLRYEPAYDGVVTLYEGSCPTSRNYSLGVHLVINILGSLLFWASNLCIQLLVAPTRSEVDIAHSKGKWLDIGVSSWRNFSNLSVANKMVCITLALSSIPIHFLYNSAIFSTVSTNSYVYATVTEAFLFSSQTNMTFSSSNGSNIVAPTDIDKALHTSVTDANNPFGHWGISTDDTIRTMVQIHNDVRDNLHTYQNLSNFDCINAYHSPFEWRPHVLLVSRDYDAALMHNTSLLTWGSNSPNSGNNRGSLYPISWTKGQSYDWQDPAEINSSVIATWSQEGNRVHYCLRRQQSPGEDAFKKCRVQCAPQILLVVVIFNLLKCCTMLWLLYCRPQHTLCTVGDAIASFLEQPDASTAEYGIVSSNRVQRCSKTGKLRCKRHNGIWRPQRRFLFQAASFLRWLLTFAVSFLIICLGLAVLSTGLAVIKKYEYSISLATLWSLGFGSTNYNAIISWNQPTSGSFGLFVNIVITNIWQVLLSLCYVLHNMLLSCMLVAEEWAGFATDRKFLRVSHPRGKQRSTYFVSMPLRYGVPVLTLFVLEHWLLSQSTFIIRVMNFDLCKQPVSEAVGWTTSGFSTMPAILAIILPVLLIIAQIAIGSRKFPDTANIPLVSTCSLAISANCHRPDDDTEAHLLPVQWGVIDVDESQTVQCSFTTLRTTAPPKPGSHIWTIRDR